MDVVLDLAVVPEVLVQDREHIVVTAARLGDIGQVLREDALVDGVHRVARRVPVDGRDDHRSGQARPHYWAAVEDQWWTTVRRVAGAPGQSCVADRAA